MEEIVNISKLVHGGQGLGELVDGRKVFVWNALPEEKVRARIIKNKGSYAEAIAEKVITASLNRIEPVETNFLATSPWQIINFESENHWKKEITKELFTQAGISLPDLNIITDNKQFHYRNKMEYSFWGDDDGLHLALYKRGTHGKEIVQGSKLAMPVIDLVANAVLTILNNRGERAGNLKTLIVRASQNGEAVAALFVKTDKFPKLDLPNGLKGLRVYYSNPKSPASVATKLIYELGDARLEDKLLNKTFTYDVDSFFQVNLPVFEFALSTMKRHINSDEITDMYSGVGTIGLSLALKATSLIELDPATASMARINAESSGLDAEVIETSSEKALKYIDGSNNLTLDPPRAGLHGKLLDKVLEALPSKIAYLSCNPATQARDIALLKDAYKIAYFEVFNFFPRTPHIESLAILVRGV